MQERAAGTAQAGAPDQSLALAFMVLNNLDETGGERKYQKMRRKSKGTKGKGLGAP